MMLLPLQGVLHRCTIPQGVALGYELLPLQGEALNTEARSHGEYIFKFSEDSEIFLELRGYAPHFSLPPHFPLSRIFSLPPHFPLSRIFSLPRIFLCPVLSLSLVLSLSPAFSSALYG